MIVFGRCIFISILLLISTSVKGQGYLEVVSTVFSCNENNNNIKLECIRLGSNNSVMVPGRRIQEAKKDTLENRILKFVINLDLNAKYKLIFSDSSCNRNVIYFDTNVPLSDAKTIFSYRFKLTMSSIVDTVNAKLGYFQGTLIRFSPGHGDFDYVNEPNKAISVLLYNLGVEQLSRNKYTEASDCFTDALHYIPNDIDALFNRAVARLKLNDKSGACQDLSLIKELGDPEAENLLKKYCY